MEGVVPGPAEVREAFHDGDRGGVGGCRPLPAGNMDTANTGYSSYYLVETVLLAGLLWSTR